MSRRASPTPWQLATALRRRARERRDVPPPGRVRFGDLRRTSALSRSFGYDRGTPVDRRYIEAFLQRCSADVRGVVLEVGDRSYTERFGGERVTRSEIVDITPDNPRATIVDDLARPSHLPHGAFDCVICTQTLHLISDMAAAVRTLERALAPGGVALATLPGITHIDRPRTTAWYWSVTRFGAAALFDEVFGPDNVEVRAHGNVLAAIAFLHGIAAEELREDELAVRDPCYDLVVTVRARKAGR